MSTTRQKKKVERPGAASEESRFMLTLRQLAGDPERDKDLAAYAGVVPSKVTAWKKKRMEPTMNVFGILLGSIGHEKTVQLFLAALEDQREKAEEAERLAVMVYAREDADPRPGARGLHGKRGT